MLNIHQEEIVYYPKKKKEEDKIFIRAQRNIQSGLLDGFLEIYNKDGTLKEKILYINGVQEHKTIEYFEDDSYHVYFPNTKKISVRYSKNMTQYYSMEGKLIEEKQYNNNNILIQHIFYGVFTDIKNIENEEETKPKRKKVILQFDDNGKFLNEQIY